MQFFGIIPARYASTRFPGKPLVDINGKTMIQRVYERARLSKRLSDVVVATDDSRIFDHVSAFGKVVMTSAEHTTGTDRCLQATTLLSVSTAISANDVVVNIQGDEPYIDPLQIDQLCSCMDKAGSDIATLVKIINDPGDVENENVVKVVFNAKGDAMYFSRHPIPFVRGAAPSEWFYRTPFYKHIGMYAYRFGVLQNITRLGTSSYEKAESLEQLRWLQAGYTISVAETDIESHSVDIPEDITRLPSG